MQILSFKSYLQETAKDTFDIVKTGYDSKGLDNKVARDAINIALDKACSSGFPTAYIALGTIAKVVAYAGIILPHHLFLGSDEGHVVFSVAQFAEVVNKDQVNTGLPDNEYYLYFEYQKMSDGMYRASAAICNSSELSGVMEAIEEELVVEEDNEQLDEEKEILDYNPPKDPYDAIKHHRKMREYHYKRAKFHHNAGNDEMADKHHSLSIRHEEGAAKIERRAIDHGFI